MLQIKSFEFNDLQENTYVLFDETKECVVIDPGCYTREEKEELKSFISENNLKVVKLLNTHCHIDHVTGNAFVKNEYRVPLIIHPVEKEILKAAEVYAGMYGFFQYETSDADAFINEGDKVSFGNTTLEVLFLPGHSPGHVAFIEKNQKLCFSGDVLFFRSIGRADLPGGNYSTLINSITHKLFSLDPDTIVFPGHGPETNIGDEKKFNPFLN